MRFLPLNFVWIAVFTGIFLERYGKVNWQLFSDWKYILLLILTVAVAVIWNILSCYGLQKEDLHEYELIMLLSPLATIIFAAIFLPAERSWSVFVPAIVASIALIATRFRKHHVKIGAAAWRTIVAMLLMSFESILIKELLAVASPVSLYFVRTVAVAIVLLILYRPKMFSMPPAAYALTILSSMFGVVQMILKFYGFQSLGVVETTMILVLGPFLVYLASAIFFKERLFKRDLFAATVVVLCILYVEFWR
jgi:drug/metabolite transporter (DMT)-like permease